MSVVTLAKSDFDVTLNYFTNYVFMVNSFAKETRIPFPIVDLYLTDYSLVQSDVIVPLTEEIGSLKEDIEVILNKYMRGDIDVWSMSYNDIFSQYINDTDFCQRILDSGRIAEYIAVLSVFNTGVPLERLLPPIYAAMNEYKIARQKLEEARDKSCGISRFNF